LDQVTKSRFSRSQNENEDLLQFCNRFIKFSATLQATALILIFLFLILFCKALTRILRMAATISTRLVGRGMSNVPIN
jgi:uncharacterized protein HemY